jgi:hypothetical protein
MRLSEINAPSYQVYDVSAGLDGQVATSNVDADIIQKYTSNASGPYRLLSCVSKALLRIAEAFRCSCCRR